MRALRSNRPREICARCGRKISSRVMPYVWRDNVVCQHCHTRLRALDPAIALSRGAMPVLRYTQTSRRQNPLPRPGTVLGRCFAVVKTGLRLAH